MPTDPRTPGHNPKDTPAPDPQKLLAGYFNGTLNAAQLPELERWVRADPSHADTFARYAVEQRALENLLKRGRVGGLSDLTLSEFELPDPEPAQAPSSAGTLAELAAMETRAESADPIDLTERMKVQALQARRAAAGKQHRTAPQDQGPRVIVIPKVLVWSSIAAVLLIGAALFLANTGRGPTAPPPVAEHGEDTLAPSQTQQPAAPVAVATLVFAEDAVWARPDRAPRLNARVLPGPLELQSGIAHLTLDCGAVLMLKGPVQIDLTNAWVTELSGGSLVARVPEQAHGYKVVGQGFVVTDLGTEFALRVDRGDVQCRVVLGEVEVAVADPDGHRDTVQRLEENRLVAIEAGTAEVRDLDHSEADDIAWALPYTALLNRNLVVNGDFEDGWPGMARDSSDIDDIDIPGWDDGPATVLDYRQAGALGEGFFPNPETDPVPADRGNGYYVGAKPGTMTQSIGLAELSELTDAGKAAFRFSADLGGLTSQSDHARVSVTFLDGTGRSLWRAELDIVDNHARRDRSGFIYRSEEGVLPAGTRSARVEVTAVHGVGGLTDAYADNIALVVDAATPSGTDISPAASRGRLSR